jgi:NAD(P)-dependent dehydrogenase (short-subunit alcohol dehydrogenase family)
MQNNVVIITGASKGIGRQTVLTFAEAGYQTVVVATNKSSLLKLKEEIKKLYNRECLVCCGDLSDMRFVHSIPESAIERFGRIDVLINNAAWRTIETMRTINLATWEKTLRICITAPAFLAKLCAAVMEERNIKGVIVNTSSIMSQQAGGNSPAYIACKGALESLTKELAVTYGRSGIRVLCLKPGFIDTEMSNDYTSDKGDNISEKMAKELLEKTPLGRPGSPDDIARAMVWLASPNAGYITGCDLTIDGGLSNNFNSYPIKKLQFPNEY